MVEYFLSVISFRHILKVSKVNHPDLLLLDNFNERRARSVGRNLQNTLWVLKKSLTNNATLLWSV